MESRSGAPRSSGFASVSRVPTEKRSGPNRLEGVSGAPHGPGVVSVDVPLSFRQTESSVVSDRGTPLSLTTPGRILVLRSPVVSLLTTLSTPGSRQVYPNPNWAGCDRGGPTHWDPFSKLERLGDKEIDILVIFFLEIVSLGRVS